MSAKSVLLVSATMSADERVFVSTGAAVQQQNRIAPAINAHRTLDLLEIILSSLLGYALGHTKIN